MTFAKTIALPLVLITLCGSLLDAQTPQNGAYKKQRFQASKPLPYDQLREADVMWEKRIWRVIDTREKMNKPFTYPREPFITVLKRGLMEASLEAYRDEDFTERMDGDALENIFSKVDTFIIWNDETVSFDTFIAPSQLNPEDVTKFRLKEDWIFDEETSTLIVRIIGIAPVRDVYDENDEFLGEEPLFWLHYPSCRKYLATVPAYNENNRAQGSLLSWEQHLEMRLFASYVIKESNVYDRRISNYAAGIDMILESERIHEDIRTYEHELWSY